MKQVNLGVISLVVAGEGREEKLCGGREEGGRGRSSWPDGRDSPEGLLTVLTELAPLNAGMAASRPAS